MTPISLGIIVPCFNEEEVIDASVKILLSELKELVEKKYINNKSKIYIIDDGSTDSSWEKAVNNIAKYKNILGIRLSRNFGHQNALIAGMHFAINKFDAVITIDADLQDDVKKIKDMLNYYSQGYKIVYGVRNSREKDTVFKRTTANLYYKLLKFLGVEVIENHGDYRLVDNEVLKKLQQYNEKNLFLRGIFPTLGFKSATVSYSRKQRQAGKTKYSVAKMVSLALKGITSFSIKPLRLLTITGTLVFVTSLVLGIWAIYIYFVKNTAVGWASTVVPLYFLGGIQIMSMGIMGEYIGKIYIEVKGRPLYIIEEIKES